TASVGSAVATRSATSRRSTERSWAIVQPARSRRWKWVLRSAPPTGEPRRARARTRARHSGRRSRVVSPVSPPRERPATPTGLAGRLASRGATSASTRATKGSRRSQVRAKPSGGATTRVCGPATARPKASILRLVSAQPCWEKSSSWEAMTGLWHPSIPRPPQRAGRRAARGRRARGPGALPLSLVRSCVRPQWPPLVLAPGVVERALAPVPEGHHRVGEEDAVEGHQTGLDDGDLGLQPVLHDPPAHPGGLHRRDEAPAHLAVLPLALQEVVDGTGVRREAVP